MQKRPRILVVGSFVMDLIVSAPRFPRAGESVIGTGYQMASGGKGANQAVQAARLGADVTMVGKLGDDAFGHAMLRSVAASGVNTEHVLFSADTFSAVGNVQLETRSGGAAVNRIIVVPGANMTITPEDVAFLKEDMGLYDLVVLQLEIPMEINLLAASWAKEAGVPVMLNCAPFAPIPEKLLQCITYVSPNETEAGLMTGIEVSSDEKIAAALKKIRIMGVPNALITLGSRGVAYLDSNDQLLVSPAVKGLNVQDPTAAGDSFVGAFSVALSAGLPMAQVLKFANYTAAITVTRMGAQPSLPTMQEVFALLRERGEDLSAFAGLM